jgi:hypothetical protein
MTNCSYDDATIINFKNAIKEIVRLFQSEIAKVSSEGNILELKDGNLAKSFINGFNAILVDKDITLTNVQKCIQDIKIQAENKGVSVENKDTASVMYTDTIVTSKIHFIKTIQMIIGIIIISFFLFSIRE